MPENNPEISVLGLFPAFGDGYVGGIQTSGEIAWKAVASCSKADLLVYSKDGPTTNGHARNNSRIHALFSALRNKEAHDVILVWQIGLLKLIPFLRHGRKRVVLFLHGIEAWKKQDWLTNRVTQNVDLFLTNSDYTWNRFLEFNPSLKKAEHRTVALGLEESLGESHVLPGSQPMAFMLARLSRAENYKGHREVINSWPRVAERVPGAKLIIAGSGDLCEDLEKAIKASGMSSNIELVGEVSEESKRQLITQSRCLLMPSRNEGFGLVYLEAMRLGRPCLVSTLDAGREVVNPPEAGIAVNPDNRDELTDGICRLLDQGDHWRELSKRARTRYEHHFTAKHFQSRLLSALFN
jgi:phosphatidylinositol alpha-1,6-mannosyltransferase